MPKRERAAQAEEEVSKKATRMGVRARTMKDARLRNSSSLKKLEAAVTFHEGELCAVAEIAKDNAERVQEMQEAMMESEDAAFEARDACAAALSAQLAASETRSNARVAALSTRLEASEAAFAAVAAEVAALRRQRTSEDAPPPQTPPRAAAVTPSEETYAAEQRGLNLGMMLAGIEAVATKRPSTKQDRVLAQAKFLHKNYFKILNVALDVSFESDDKVDQRVVFALHDLVRLLGGTLTARQLPPKAQLACNLLREAQDVVEQSQSSVRERQQKSTYHVFNMRAYFEEQLLQTTTLKTSREEMFETMTKANIAPAATDDDGDDE